MFLVFSHVMTHEQKSEAHVRFCCSSFVEMPSDISSLWSNVPPGLENIMDYAGPILQWLETCSQPGDYCLIEGDFGMTYIVVQWAQLNGRIPVYSSTERVFETHTAGDGAIVNTHRFRHVRFRHYRTYG